MISFKDKRINKNYVFVLFSFIVVSIFSTVGASAQAPAKRDTIYIQVPQQNQAAPHPNSRYYNSSSNSNSNSRVNKSPTEKKVYPNPNGILTYYPFALVGSHLMLGYEHGVSSKVGIKINASYGLSESNTYYNVRDMQGYSFEAQARFYPTGNSIKGVFGAGYLQYKQMAFKNDYYTSYFPFVANTAEQKVSAISFGGIIGYQAVFGGIFVLDMYAGGGIVTPNWDKTKSTGRLNNFIDTYEKGVAAHIGFSLGIVLY